MQKYWENNPHLNNKDQLKVVPISSLLEVLYFQNKRRDLENYWKEALNLNYLLIKDFFEYVVDHDFNQIEEIPPFFLTKVRETRNILLEISSRAFFSVDTFSDEFITLAVKTNNLIVKSLTSIENWLYRNGEQKSKERTLLFILTKAAGETWVPSDQNHPQENMKVLDYRKIGATQDKQLGELAETVAAYETYLKEKNDENALAVLVELADVVYNTAQAIGLPAIFEAIQKMDIEPDSKELFKRFVLLLMQVATIKFVHRYMLAEEKNESFEKVSIKRKLGRQEIDPLKILSENHEIINVLIKFFYDLNLANLKDTISPYFQMEDDSENANSTNNDLSIYLSTFIINLQFPETPTKIS